MPVDFGFGPTDAIRFLPEIILSVAATLLMVLDPVVSKRWSNVFGHLSILALIGGIAGAVYAYGNPGPAFGGLLMVDGFATFFRVLVMGVGILTVLPSYAFLRRQQAEAGEYHSLLLFSIAGQCIMASANELIIVFIGLEISSIASYVLAGYLRDDKRANESALKYFLLGSFATAFFLYGAALIYGATGTVELTQVRALLAGPSAPSPVFVGVAAALIFVGLAFKVSAAPFQSVGAGCLSGSAHAGGGVPFRGAKGGRLRGVPAHLHDGLRAYRRRLGAAGVDVRAALDDHRQLRRAVAIEYQAAAGV